MLETRGTLYRADPLFGGQIEAKPIRSFTAPVFHEKGRAEKFALRLKEHECWGYSVGGEVVSYFWLAEGPATAPLWKGVSLEVPEDVFYVWDCRTAEGHQRQGWYTKALEDARRIAAPSDIWVACEDENAASVSVIRRQFSPMRSYRLSKAGPIYRGAGLSRVLSPS